MERQEEFKSGLGSGKEATKRHVQRYEGIRKKKREQALARIRHAGAGSGGGEGEFERLLKQFDAKAMCQKGNVQALDILKRCLHMASDAQINAHMITSLRLQI